MWRLLALAAAVSITVGCGGKKEGGLPPTFPVKGKVVDAKGNPLKGGTIHFDSGKGADQSVMGVIGTDGTYALKTFRDKLEADGAPEGDYQVTVIFLLSDGNAPPPPVTLPGRFKVEAKDNTLDFDLKKTK